MTEMGDPAVRAHLNRVHALYAEAGAIEYLQRLIGETWRANRKRWSPSRHYDDTNTLGYQTSRNVGNRIYRTIETSDVAPDVIPQTESGVVILGLAGFRLRVVKAPIESGLAPDFDTDFDWSSSATRLAAARRNSNNYYPFDVNDLTLEFESDPRPSHRRQIDACRDIFLLWAAPLDSDRTAGWLGLPKIGDRPWMGVLDLWLDQPDAASGIGPASRTESASVADPDASWLGEPGSPGGLDCLQEDDIDDDE